MTTERAPGARPRFSVVMNVYNGSAWLEQTLVSLFAQTFTDWELIFFDDRSTDDSPALLDPYRADPRVRYVLAQQQVPLGQARAQAVALAHGEWLDIGNILAPGDRMFMQIVAQLFAPDLQQGSIQNEPAAIDLQFLHGAHAFQAMRAAQQIP
jgi:hypothetical protein